MRRIAAAGAVAVALAAVIVISAAAHRHDTLDLLPALALALLAPLAVRGAAQRFGPPWFAAAAPFIYALLPFLGLVYSLSTYRHVFVHGVAPELVGLRNPQALALGTVVAAGAGYIPATALGSLGVIAAGVALAIWGTADLSDVSSGIHETGWSPGLAAWLIVAGILGLLLARPLPALGVAGWVVAVILRSAHGGYGDYGEFWRGLAAAAPEIALLLTALALLVPPLRRARRPASSPAG